MMLLAQPLLQSLASFPLPFRLDEVRQAENVSRTREEARIADVVEDCTHRQSLGAQCYG